MLLLLLLLVVLVLKSTNLGIALKINCSISAIFTAFVYPFYCCNLH